MDVFYRKDAARAACVSFEHWEDAEPSSEHVLDIAKIEPYVPGQFYRRELPCVMAVFGKLSAVPNVLIVDGYVWLDGRGTKGLGGYLFEALGEAAAVIGVAKTPFATATSAVEVFRASSDRPLFVTAAGMDPKKAADCIRRMDGENRIPTLIKRADRLSRLNAPCE